MRARGRFRHDGGGGHFHLPGGKKIPFPGDQIHFPRRRGVGEIDNVGVDCLELDGDTVEPVRGGLEHGRGSVERDCDTLQHGSDTLELVRDGLQRGTAEEQSRDRAMSVAPQGCRLVVLVIDCLCTETGQRFTRE